MTERSQPHQNQSPAGPEKKPECDLVMKGGITSGVVYPSAVLGLKDHYRFRSIGGTSAGAIAAALCATAQYAEGTGGFCRLRQIQDQLMEPHFLKALFQPQETTRLVLDLAYAWSQGLSARKKYAPGRSPDTAEPRSPAPWESILATIGVLWGEALLAVSLGVAFPSLTWWIARDSLLASCTALRILFCLCAGSFGLALAAVVFSAAVARQVYRVLADEFPRNGFGICTGHRADYDASCPVLTDWLAWAIDFVAGRVDKPKEKRDEGTDRSGVPRPPVTFADLKGLGKSQEAVGSTDVELRMMTSNVSQGRPYDLPFRHAQFLFREDEMRRYFPDYVVDHLIESSRPSSIPAGTGVWDLREHVEFCQDNSLKLEVEEGAAAPEGRYFFLPLGDALPLVVATRLSLSFPILITAIPLYTIRAEALEGLDPTAPNAEPLPLYESHLQKNWFSDGGISSNFPIHFFDAWLPSRPTFGINLTAVPAEAGDTQRSIGGKATPAVNHRFATPDIPRCDPGLGGAPGTARAEMSLGEILATGSPMVDADFAAGSQDVFRYRAEAVPSPECDRVESLPAFLMAVFNTAQNFRDNLQSALPSYRERIVQVRLAKTEGGLNLDMPVSTLQAIQKKGTAAAELLYPADSGPPPANSSVPFRFEHHQWVRYQVLLAQMEKQLHQMSDYINAGKVNPQKLATGQLNDAKFPYRRVDQAWVDSTNRIVDELLRLTGNWDPAHVYRQDCPLEEPALRVTPDV